MKKFIVIFFLLFIFVSNADAEFLSMPKDSTSQILQIHVWDSSSSVGGLLSGLVYDSSGLTCYYNRTGAAGSATQIVLVSATKGTWTSGGFIAVDGTNMPGHYELHVPNAALVTGADSVNINCKGAADMVPVSILIRLEDINRNANVAQWNGSNIATPDTAGYPKVTIKDGAGTGEIDTNAGAIVTCTTATTCGTCTSLGSQAKTDVNTEVLDVLTVDTFAEPGQGTPSATATLAYKIGLQYKALINPIYQSSNTTCIYDNGGTAIHQKSTIGDTGVYFTRGGFIDGGGGATCPTP